MLFTAIGQIMARISAINMSPEGLDAEARRGKQLNSKAFGDPDSHREVAAQQLGF